MAKICARKQVPVPPRGYWAKKKAGKSVPKTPLPEFVVTPPKERKGALTPERQTPEKRKFASVFEERNQTIKKALKEFRKPLSEAIDYTVRIEEWRCDYIETHFDFAIRAFKSGTRRLAAFRAVSKSGIWSTVPICLRR